MAGIIGTKSKRYPLGYVVDYCPVCHVPTAMKSTETRFVRHVFWIVVADGSPLEQELVCQDCEAMYVVEPGKFEDFDLEPSVSEASISRTNPGLAHWLVSRHDREERALSLEAMHTDRLQLMSEIVLSFDEMVKRKTARGHQESVSAVIGLLLGVCAVGLALCYSGHTGCTYNQYFWSLGVVLLLVLLYRAVVVSRRIKRQFSFTYLVRSLSIFHPTVGELEEISNAVPMMSYFNSIDSESLHREIRHELEQTVSSD